MPPARKPYPSDLSDAQWALLEPLLPPPKLGGRPRTVDPREVVNGVLYRARAGCTWRALPHDRPPWGTVHASVRAWRRNGTWERVHDARRERVRAARGRAPTPRAGGLDSPSVKTPEGGAAGRRRRQAGDGAQ